MYDRLKFSGMAKKTSFHEICHFQHVYNQMQFFRKQRQNDLLGHRQNDILFLFPITNIFERYFKNFSFL
jgi:hypothetical protein